METKGLRLAELLTALSVVTDLGIGRPPETAMRACILASRLASEMGLSSAEASHAYYATLLRYIGCTAYAHEEAAMAAGNELAATARLQGISPTSRCVQILRSAQLPSSAATS